MTTRQLLRLRRERDDWRQAAQQFNTQVTDLIVKLAAAQQHITHLQQRNREADATIRHYLAQLAAVRAACDQLGAENRELNRQVRERTEERNEALGGY